MGDGGSIGSWGRYRCRLRADRGDVRYSAPGESSAASSAIGDGVSGLGDLLRRRWGVNSSDGLGRIGDSEACDRGAAVSPIPSKRSVFLGVAGSRPSWFSLPFLPKPRVSRCMWF